MAARKSRVAKVLIACALALFAMQVLSIAWRIWNVPAALPSTARADAAIVLGAATSGEVPGPRFRSRLDFGFDLLRIGQVKYLIITGGVGTGKQHSEGEIGTRYLVERGADPKAILAEHNSHDTLGNLCYAEPIARSHGLRALLIVSDRTHLYRAQLLSRSIGLSALPVMSPSPFNSGPAAWWCLAKEIFSVLKRQLRGRASCREVF